MLGRSVSAYHFAFCCKSHVKLETQNSLCLPPISMFREQAVQHCPSIGCFLFPCQAFEAKHVTTLWVGLTKNPYCSYTFEVPNMQVAVRSEKILNTELTSTVHWLEGSKCNLQPRASCLRDDVCVGCPSNCQCQMCRNRSSS